MAEAISISMPPNFSGIRMAVRPSSADFRNTETATPGVCCRMSSRFGSTSLRQNSSAVRAMARCSSVKSSGVKTSSGVRSSIRNAPPLVLGNVAAAVAISLHPFKDSRGALATAHAHRHHAILRIPALHLAQNGGRELRARAAQRMAERNRPAIDVDLFEIQSRAPDHRQRLHREGLVQLDQVDIVELQSRKRQRL